jgi:hypothetical protein
VHLDEVDVGIIKRMTIKYDKFKHSQNQILLLGEPVPTFRREVRVGFGRNQRHCLCPHKQLVNT